MASTTNHTGSHAARKSPQTKRFDLRAALQPLLRVLRAYDEKRTELMTSGGGLEHVSAISEQLSTPVTIRGPHKTYDVSLAQPYEMRIMLGEVSSWTTYLDCRVSEFNLPLYYLCRTRSDYWSGSRCIIEDLHISPKYQMPDERFIRLMYAGHETSYLRLSPLRKPVKALLAEQGYGKTAENVDSLLFTMARLVFQSAWHEDQRAGLLVARHFGLDHFRQAIELVYLVLSADLCQLRGAGQGNVRRFLEQVYPQPAIVSFLGRLADTDATALTRLQREALPLYQRLSRAFGLFLQTEVSWPARQEKLPLFKLIFSNIDRLEVVASSLTPHPGDLTRAAENLESVATDIIGEIICQPDLDAKDSGDPR